MPQSNPNIRFNQERQQVSNTAANPNAEQEYLDRRSSANEVRCRELLRGMTKPRIGMALSGGGARSAIASYGQCLALHEDGLLDLVDYIAGVSGGSWFIGQWLHWSMKRNHSVGIDHKDAGKSLLDMVYRAWSEQIFHARNKRELIEGNSRVRTNLDGMRYFSNDQRDRGFNVSCVDPFSVVLLDALCQDVEVFTSVSELIHTHTDRNAAANVMPFPIFECCVTRSMTTDEENEPFEITPFTAGFPRLDAHVPINEFGKKGYYNEDLFGLTLATCGSAPLGALTFERVKKLFMGNQANVEKLSLDQISQDFMDKDIKELDKFTTSNEIAYQFSAVPSRQDRNKPMGLYNNLKNFVHGISQRLVIPKGYHSFVKDQVNDQLAKDQVNRELARFLNYNSPCLCDSYLYALDGGTRLNIPITSLLQRNLDIIIVFDNSRVREYADKRKEGLELELMCEFAVKNNLPFPVESTRLHLQKDPYLTGIHNNPGPIVLSPNDDEKVQGAPTIIYFSLVSSGSNSHSIRPEDIKTKTLYFERNKVHGLYSYAHGIVKDKYKTIVDVICKIAERKQHPGSQA